MKFSLPNNWSNSVENDGVLYFAQRLEEMLFDYSIDLYRMPLLNTHGLVREYCDVIKRVKLGEVKEYQRNIVFEELIESLKNDIVLKECWGVDNIDKIIKSIGSSSQQTKDNTVSYLKASFGHRRYFDWCVNTIIKYTNQPKQKKKIESTLRCFLPELIASGYDADFIYKKMRQCFFGKESIDKNSVQNYLGNFDFKVHQYTVYFSVSTITLSFRSILEKRLNLHFDDDGNFSRFKKDNNKRIVYFDDIKAYCPNSAARIAYDKLDLFFSFYKFVGNKRHFSVQNKAMISDKENDPIFIDAKKVSYKIIEEVDFDQIGIRSDELITGLLINAKSEYSLLSKSIELHNTALAIPDLKSGFLNLWASIEVLCQNQNAESKLDAVLGIVLPILKKDYLITIINDIDNKLKANMCKEDYEYILNQVNVAGCENKKLLYMLLLKKNQELRKEVIEKLVNYPVLRSRISLFDEMKSTKDLKSVIEKYIQRITWHLYRMYRTRNAIIHSGEIPSNIKYLGEHLHSYVDSTVSEFIVKLSGDIPFKSIDDVLTDLKFASNNFEEAIQKDKVFDENIINILIHPELGYVMNCEAHVDKSDIEEHTK